MKTSKDFQDQFFMRHALKQARHAKARGEVPIGAVIVGRDNSDEEIVLGQGFNQPITHSDPSAHAEILALREVGKKINNYRLLNTTLYVTLEPCPMCAYAMVYARIRRLVFGAYDPNTGAVGGKLNLLDDFSFNHRITWQGGILKDECAQLLTDFFIDKR